MSNRFTGAAAFAFSLLLAGSAAASQCPPLSALNGTWVLGTAGQVVESVSKDADGAVVTVTEAEVTVDEVLSGKAGSSVRARATSVENYAAMMVTGHRLAPGRVLLGGQWAADGALEVSGCSGFNGESVADALERVRGL